MHQVEQQTVYCILEPNGVYFRLMKFLIELEFVNVVYKSKCHHETRV